jgi:hypothetical protein
MGKYMDILARLLTEPSIVIGVISIVFSIPLLRGEIEMNGAYGFRIRKALASKENWYSINKYGAKEMIIWSSVLILVGVVIVFLEVTPPLSFIPVLIATGVPIVRTILFARKLSS